MSHRVVLIIEPGGEMSSTVEGIEGPTCEGKTKWLDALGRIKTHKRTPDYHAHVATVKADETVKVEAGGAGGAGGDEGGHHGSPW